MIPWNKGLKTGSLTLEHKLEISKSLMGFNTTTAAILSIAVITVAAIFNNTPLDTLTGAYGALAAYAVVRETVRVKTGK